MKIVFTILIKVMHFNLWRLNNMVKRMIWKHWMVLEIVEVENYAERIEKMNEFIEYMESE